MHFQTANGDRYPLRPAFWPIRDSIDLSDVADHHTIEALQISQIL